MALTEQDIASLRRKVDRYHEMLENTRRYRELWHTSLKQHIISQLQSIMEVSGLTARIERREDIQNLEAVVFSLGKIESGISESVGDELRRALIKQNGSLVYQQLFNGKILVLINMPCIEKDGQPRPSKTISIYRPEEMKEPYFLRHVETLLADVTAWEDYDDDIAPEHSQRIGYKMNFERMAQANATQATDQ